MNIVVLIKAVDGGTSAINYDDANNLEAALRIKEEHAAEGICDHIAVVTLGKLEARTALREAMAVGADQGCLVEEGCGWWDKAAAAKALSRAVKQLGPFDLIMTGYQSQDDRSGATGPMVAEFLGIPQVTHVERLTVAGSGLLAEKRLLDWVEEIQAPLPCLVSNIPQPYRLRGATYLGITEALSKEIVHYRACELEEESGRAENDKPETTESICLLSEPLQRGRRRLISGDGEAGSGMIKRIINDLTQLKHARK